MKKTSTLLLLILLSTNCAKKNDPVVARFGEHQITLREFRTAYLEVLKQPTMYDSPALRESFLDEMINRKLLAAEARNLSMDKDEKFQLKADAYKNKCLREAHYQHVIEPQIKIKDALIKEIYPYTREQRHVKHLFFTRKSTADSAYQYLKAGASFDELAQIVFADNNQLSGSGGDLGWVNWDQLEYDMAITAFRLEKNEISAPVKSSFGYHILKVVDWKKELFIGEDEYNLHKEKTALLVKSKIGDQLANEYFDKMMSDPDIKIRPRELEKVAQAYKKYFSTVNGDSTTLSDSLKHDEVNDLETDLWELRDNPLFYIDDQAITIGQFISNLPYIPTPIFRTSFKKVIDYSIRDFQLTREAQTMKLAEKSGIVNIKSNIYDDYLLQIMLRKKIITGIHVTDNEIRNRYEKLTTGKKDVKSYTHFKNEMTEIIMREKRATEVPSYIHSIRKDVDIKKNVAIIHEYYNSITN